MSVALENRMLELNLPADPRVVREIRDKFEEFLAPYSVGSEDIETLKVALSEACSNAVCHGSPRGQLNRIEVRCDVRDDCLIIEVSDEGRGFRPQEIVLPESEEWKPSGRGLFLMQAMMDDVRFEPTPTGTKVHLVKHLHRPACSGDREAMRAGPVYS
jgi:serine/threonine-protein kinase RsbW